MRSVNVWLQDLQKVTIPIGFEGENLFTTVNINCKKIFDENDSFVPTLVITSPSGEMYPGIVTRSGDIVTWQVTASDLVTKGAGEFQLAFTHDEVIGKTYVAKTRIERSLVPTGDAPAEIENFIIEAGTIVNGIPQAIQDALTAAKESGDFDGPPGEDGYSPTATVSKVGKTATITITDKNGTTSAQISDGEDGSGGGTEIFDVHLSMDIDEMTGESTITADKTIAEIFAAQNAKEIIRGVVLQPTPSGYNQPPIYLSTYTAVEFEPGFGQVMFFMDMDNAKTIIFGTNLGFGGQDHWETGSTMYMAAFTDSTIGGYTDYNAGSLKITNLGAPTANTDAANKAYVDNAVAGKISEPQSDGTSGQVLTTNGNGGRSWTTVQGGANVFLVTFTGAMDMQTGSLTVTSDKTVAEILEAEDDGKVIHAVLSMMGGQQEIFITEYASNKISQLSDQVTFTLKIGNQTAVIAGAAVPNSNDQWVLVTFTYLSASQNSPIDPMAFSAELMQIKDVATPTDSMDAATKGYVDTVVANAPVSVSGTTPTITGESGKRYICGECSTLTITAPASGCVDITFTSGSTPTVLTVSSAKTGVTAIKWANGFDPTSLDANTTYEVNILDGEFGVVGSWT